VNNQIMYLIFSTTP